MVSLLNCHAAPHITSSTFGSTVFGRAAISDEHRGSRIAPYATTAEVDGASFEQPAGSWCRYPPYPSTETKTTKN